MHTLATLGVLALLILAAVLGVLTTLDGVYDGRTALAVGATILAVIIWRRITRGVHR